MGKLESEARKERRLGEFQQALLGAAAIGFVVVVAAMAPNTAQLLRFFPGYKKGARFNYQTKSALGRLRAKGLVTFVSRDGKKYARVTEKGRRMLELGKQKVIVAKKRHWDQHWRVVIFDIPEYRKSIRVRLRRFMSEYGFVRLQDSVWVYPYDCEDLIALVKADFRVGADVLYMIVRRLERDTHLREHFGLPLTN